MKNTNCESVTDVSIFLLSNNPPQPDKKDGTTKLELNYVTDRTAVIVSENSGSSDDDFVTDGQSLDATQRTNKKKQCYIADIISDNSNIDSEKPILRTTVLQMKSVNTSNEERLDGLLELIDLNHLDTDETNNIITLIRNHRERFHLPEEQLSATHVLRHRIPTVDDLFNTKDRFSQIHKAEINR